MSMNLTVLKTKVADLIQFVQVDLWNIRLADLPKSRSTLYHNLRIVILTGQDFVKDNCAMQASALTYLSILSIVPVIATFFGMAKGFGLDINLAQELNNLFPGQETVLGESVKYAQNMLDTARGGIIAGISIMVLLYTVLRLFHNIEMAFNGIWAIKKQRSIIRKVTDYLSIMIISPIILVLSSSMTVFITTQLDVLVVEYDILDSLVGLVKFGLRAVPLILICFMFSLLFIVMPNTKVKFKSAFYAGLITALAYQFLQYFYIEFQVGVSRYNAIYGSFAALPLFFIWVQLSWTLVLFGAEFAFAHQNANRHYFDNDKTKPSLASKKRLALLIMTAIAKNFERGDDGLTDEVIAERIGVPIRFVVLMLEELKEAKLIHEATDDNDDLVFLPSIDVHKLTIEFVVDRLEKQGLDQMAVGKLSEVDALVSALDDLKNTARQSSSNRLLIEL